MVCVSLVIYNYKHDEATALIYSDGVLVEKIRLGDVDEGYEFTVGDENRFNVIKVEKGRIRVSSASCPDKICVEQGYISDGLVPIVCLPNKLVIEIKGGDSGADISLG